MLTLNMKGKCIFFVICTLVFLSVEVRGEDLQCYADESAPKDDPNNIYSCKSGSKCCKEKGVPSCCTVKPTTQSINEQIQLWGTLAGLIFALALVLFCCRNDGDWCCNRKDGARYKYFCCGPLVYREGKDPKELETEDSFDQEENFPPAYREAINSSMVPANNQAIVPAYQGTFPATIPAMAPANPAAIPAMAPVNPAAIPAMAPVNPAPFPAMMPAYNSAFPAMAPTNRGSIATNNVSAPPNLQAI